MIETLLFLWCTNFVGSEKRVKTADVCSLKLPGSNSTHCRIDCMDSFRFRAFWCSKFSWHKKTFDRAWRQERVFFFPSGTTTWQLKIKILVFDFQSGSTTQKWNSIGTREESIMVPTILVCLLLTAFIPGACSQVKIFLFLVTFYHTVLFNKQFFCKNSCACQRRLCTTVCNTSLRRRALH